MQQSKKLIYVSVVNRPQFPVLVDIEHIMLLTPQPDGTTVLMLRNGFEIRAARSVQWFDSMLSDLYGVEIH